MSYEVIGEPFEFGVDQLRVNVVAFGSPPVRPTARPVTGSGTVGGVAEVVQS